MGGDFGAEIKEGNATSYIYWGLKAQNHRGQQSYGLFTFDEMFYGHKDLGLVPDVERGMKQEWFDNLPGNVGLGSVLYSTSGKTDRSSLIKITQPIIEGNGKVRLALTSNGGLPNPSKLLEDVKKISFNYSNSCDAGLLCKKLQLEYERRGDLKEAVKSCMNIDGAFSVVGVNQDGELFAFKDSHGIRPLCCGYNENVHAISSETVGLNINNLELDFEISPGEMVTVSKDGFEREKLVPCKRRALCAFEFAYVARPDSKLGDRFVYEVREEFGRNLGREYSEIVKNVDIILSIPQTGNDAAYGLHEETGKRWERATRRHRFVTQRAFMLSKDERQETVDKKVNILSEKMKGMNIAVIDDSIVRGDTTKGIIEKLRRYGVRKVYMFPTFPQIRSPCFYGTEMATFGELIGANHEPDEIAKIIGADELCYQPIDSFVRATGLSRDELCLGCLTGRYPTREAQIRADIAREKFERGLN